VLKTKGGEEGEMEGGLSGAVEREAVYSKRKDQPAWH